MRNCGKLDFIATRLRGSKRRTRERDLDRETQAEQSCEGSGVVNCDGTCEQISHFERCEQLIIGSCQDPNPGPDKVAQLQGAKHVSMRGIRCIPEVSSSPPIELSPPSAQDGLEWIC